jgi:hypothetical protein
LDYKKRLEYIQNSSISFSYLKKFNIAAGVLHTVQGLLMLALGLLLEWERDIYTFYLNINFTSIDPLVFEVAPDPQIAFTISYLGVILASFPIMSALAHYLIAFPKNKSYNQNLKSGWNPYRWYEYAFSSSIMIVLISFLTGVWELWSLVMIFVLNAMMVMFGYYMEVINQKRAKTTWGPFIMGTISGGTPWVVLFAYFFSAVSSSGVEPPTFVYMIIFIYFFMFNIFAFNILAWIVFVGIFAPF